MAVFSEAYLKMLPYEGGYANVAGDRGGETYAGVSRKYHPSWEGWAIVDRNKPIKHNQKIVSSELEQMVAEFYRVNFWDKMKGTEIKDQQAASFIFDWYINSGAIALKKVQSLVGVTPDGAFGPKTIEAINSFGEGLFLALKGKRTVFVKDIVKNNPSQEKFLKGWLNRINSF